MAAVNDIYAVRVFCSLGDQVSVNVLTYRVENLVLLGPTDTEIATTFDQAWGPLYKAVMSSQATYRGLQVQKIRPLPIHVATQSTAAAGVGLNAGDALPRQTSGILTKRTQFAGRAKRGRVYVPFAYEGANDATGNPIAAYVTGLTNLANELRIIKPIVGAGGNNCEMRPVLFHRVPGTTDNISNIVSQAKWATQRRRGSYGRPNVPPF